LRENRRVEGFTNAIAEHGYQGVRAGDLVIHSMDGFAGAIGISDSHGKASPVVHCYQPSEDVDPRFYAYLLRDAARSGFITSLAKGIRERSTAFDSETFRSLMLPVPDFRVQRAIADFLDTETARIDALIAKKRRMIALLERRWRSAVEHRMVELAANYGSVPLKRLVRCLDGARDLGKMLGDQINLLAEHRQALITAAVTGRIEVPEAAAR
jgi:type I restriction enzyme S subunit